MKFDVYFPFYSKQAEKLVPGVKPNPMEWANIVNISMCRDVHTKIADFRKGKDSTDEETVKAAKDTKESLPCICYMGKSNSTRANAYMQPTQLVMIDIDHVKEPLIAMKQIENLMGQEWMKQYLLIGHITPSGEGLRYVFLAQPEHGSTVEEQMDWFNTTFSVAQFGDLDKPCHDFSRVSFFFQHEDLFWENRDLLDREDFGDVQVLDNPDYTASPANTASAAKPAAKPKTKSADIPALTEEQIAEYRATCLYKGFPVSLIIEKYVEHTGEPGTGEKHTYYNELVKNFRNLLENDKVAIFALLPRFGHSEYECWSSIISICKTNVTTRHDKTFYYFLKDAGFWTKEDPKGNMAEYMLSDVEEKKDDDLPKYLPPIFKEFVSVAPKDFRVSTVNALLPILGTLTSYLKAEYYFDGHDHTTTFFSIIYAPAGTGKSFVTRFTELLFEQIVLRDYVQNARDAVYQRADQGRSQNEKGPKLPNTSLRIIPPKNSESEFLEKQKNNCGYHMFTYAAEMDSWAKGVKAAGGNKDDMIRIAWDNEVYGQQFKATSTFKGSVRLHWNVLITGTIQQILAYYKNVENGLITRCSFTTIDNQRFAAAAVWKPLTKKNLQAIHKFMERCDRNTYYDPCTVTVQEVDEVEDSKFDDEIEWHFQFRPRQTVSMEWLRPTITKWLERQRKKAALDFDDARDVFRKRVAVRGFRLGILCHALWEKPRECDLKKCIPFIEWWMNKDLESSLELWGVRYNEATKETGVQSQKSLYGELPTQFDRNIQRKEGGQVTCRPASNNTGL